MVQVPDGIATGGLMQSMRSRRDKGTPGEVIAHFAKRLPEQHALLCQLTAEHMFALREDYVKAFIEPAKYSMNELWRQWHEQVRPAKPVPEITPEVACRLADESRQLRKEFDKMLKRLHTITLEERQAVSR